MNKTIHKSNLNEIPFIPQNNIEVFYKQWQQQSSYELLGNVCTHTYFVAFNEPCLNMRGLE